MEGMVPLWLKIAYGVFVPFLIVVYWPRYGPSNFLWLSDIALFMIAGAVIFESPLLASLPEPNAMTLATVSLEGKPSARIVLMKDYSPEGFSFFTNYNSRKGQELAAHPFACLVFLWDELERQVRIEGSVERVAPEISDNYFVNRPMGSRLGAWASAQSSVIPDREFLEQQHAELVARYADGEIPRPPHWGGFRVLPQVYEFWQGRPNRLHDRLRYTRNASSWLRERLAP